jgi:M6 family metalloprotease-like protein
VSYFGKRATLGLLAGLLLPVAATGQDIQVEARVTATQLPRAYYDRIASDGGFFELRGGWMARAEGARAAGASVTGEFPLLVVLARFADSRTPVVTPEALQASLFDGPNPAGTMTEFYEVSSGGAFTVRGVVTDWVQSDLTVAEVRGDTYGLGDDALVGEFLVDALTRVDAQVDFASFDNDGPDGIVNSGDDDGVVDALAVEFLESAITCSGQGPTVWAHRSRIEGWLDEPFVSTDIGASGEPIRANDYIIQAAERCDGRIQSAVVISHEFGHALGLPDLYDSTEGILSTQRNWVVGCWSIMAAGQWGCGPALAEGRWDRPTHFGPWEKSELGWLPNLIVATDVLDAEFTLGPVESTGEVLRVDLSDTEHLFIEYRDGSGFDANLPGTGILIHHIDETRTSGSRRCRTCDRIYQVALLEADANSSLVTPEGEGGSRGEAGDAFRPNQTHTVTNTTIPSTRLNSGAASDVSIYQMEVVNGVAHIRLSTRTVGPDALLAPFFETGGTGPTALERDYLDAHGNQNGRYDLGDLSLYFEEHPSALARALEGF